MQEKLKGGWGSEWEKEKPLFTRWDGSRMGYQTPYYWFRDFIIKHNTKIKVNQDISEEEKPKYLLPTITFHGLRHTSATLLISQKTDIKTVSARLGHSQASTTLNIYSHSLRSSDQRASTALENLLEKKKENEISKQA